MPSLCWSRVGGGALCAGATTSKCGKLTGENDRKCDMGCDRRWVDDDKRRTKQTDWASRRQPSLPPFPAHRLPPTASGDVLPLLLHLGDSELWTPTTLTTISDLTSFLPTPAFPRLPTTNTTKSTLFFLSPLPGDLSYPRFRSAREHKHYPWAIACPHRTAMRRCARRR